MSISFIVCEDESLSISNPGVAHCMGSGWKVVKEQKLIEFVQEHSFSGSSDFDISQIDPTVATAMFGAGFALFLIPWASAWGYSLLLKSIRGL